MNRRDVLKAAAATAAVVTLPAVAKPLCEVRTSEIRTRRDAYSRVRRQVREARKRIVPGYVGHMDSRVDFATREITVTSFIRKWPDGRAMRANERHKHCGGCPCPESFALGFSITYEMIMDSIVDDKKWRHIVKAIDDLVDATNFSLTTYDTLLPHKPEGARVLMKAV